MLSCGGNSRKRKDALIRKIDSTQVILNREIKYDSGKMLEINRLIKLSDSIDYQKGIVTVSVAGAKIYMLDFQAPKALEMLEKAKTAAEKADDPGLSALVNFYFGYFNSRIGNADAALDYYMTASRLSDEAKDSTMLSGTWLHTGNLYLQKGFPDKAVEYLKKSIALNTLRADRENLAIDYHVMSIIHLKKGAMDSAKHYLEIELKLSKESGNTVLYIYNLNNLANLYIQNGEFARGEESCLEALRLMDSISPSLGPTSSRSVIHANLGLLYRKRKDYEKSLYHYNLAYADSAYDLEPGFRTELILELFEVNTSLKRHDEAYAFLNQYLKLRNEQDKVKADQNLLTVEARYNFSKLQAEHEFSQKKMKLFFILLTVIFFMGLLSLLLFLQKQRIKAKNDALQKKVQALAMEKMQRDLASQALNIVRINEQKSNLIKTLKENLPLFRRENQSVLTGIIETFEKDRNEKVWQEFELRFTEVHTDFYHQLHRINPHLTFNEKRLCALLALDMTTKEISYITGQSIRAVEQGRIRLRKQLNLTNKNISLGSFLNSI